MNDKDLKKFTKAVSDSLKPLHGEMARVKKEVGSLRSLQFLTSSETTRIGKDVARIDSTLDDIKETLDEHTKILGQQTKILGQHTKTLGEHGKKLDAVWEHAAKLTEDVAEIQITLELHTELLKRTQANGVQSSQNVGKLDKRVTTLENQAGIAPPPELTVIK